MSIRMKVHTNRSAVGRMAKTHRDGGMTLIEVLVTLVIISVGLLGVAAMQVATVRNNYDAFVRSQAAVLASDMLDRIRANRASLGLYSVTFDVDPATGTAVGSDMAQWKLAIADQIPGGRGQIVPNVALGLVTISISWGERSDIAADRALLFVTTSRI
jgi:type IV pilus assembly protein PilV